MRSCSICARGGSKGVKSKNIRKIEGIPLLHYTLIQAIVSDQFEDIAVSSDSNEILECASQFQGVHLIKRPDELATDTAPKIPVIKHCLMELEKITGKKYQTMIDLDATSPLRTVQDIKEAIKLLRDNPDCSNVITGMNARRSPYFNLVEESGEKFVKLCREISPPVTRRQDAPRCYDMNASIYAWERDQFFLLDKVLNSKTMIYVMPEERSIDIDSELDFKIVETLLRERMSEFKGKFKR